MNKLKGSLAAKTVAIILLAASCLALCGAIAGIAWLDSQGAYQAASAQEIRNRVIDDRMDSAAYQLMDRAVNIPLSAVFEQDKNEPLRYELLDENRDVIAGNLGENETAESSLLVAVESFYGGMYFTDSSKPLTAVNPARWVTEPVTTPAPGSQVAEESEAQEETLPEGTKICFVRVSRTARSAGTAADVELNMLETLFAWRYELIVAAVCAFVLAVLMFVFLMAAAGHHDASGEVRASFVEKIPADLLWLFSIFGMGLCEVAIGEVFDGSTPIASLLVIGVCLVAAGLLLLLCLMSSATRLKLGTFLSSCLVWRLLSWCWKWIKAGFSLLRGVPLVWKWIPLFVILFLLDFAYTINNRRHPELLAIGLLFKALLLAAAILYLVLVFKRLRDGAKALAAGDENVVIDEKYMVADLKDHAEDLMHIRDGLSRAVDERLKSERLRTELITNVSHDIKTPLTSIISYVDLLAREEPENEKTREYVEVLQRQSARLKKLTDDLVEASKASTGNLPVSPEKLDLGVLLDQTAGEYGERLSAKGLDLRTSKPERPVMIWADPRHLWRIFDNLLSNILKYAQPGTRVYLDLTHENGRAELSFRNISAEALNVRPEELTERFVRGDSSRSTEGSGLGLAIAASLAKLQNIDMSLNVDGDLFKVVLRFCEALGEEKLPEA